MFNTCEYVYDVLCMVIMWQIIFLNVEDTKTLSMVYRKSRGLVYPSIDEGFGIPIIEAMYSSIPVITSNVKRVKGGISG